MMIGAARIEIKWETESRAYIHTIPRFDPPASRGQQRLLNNQYAFLKSGCGGLVGSCHDVSVRWKQQDEGNVCSKDYDGLNRYETKILSVGVSSVVPSMTKC
jgi:hypothetical protein